MVGSELDQAGIARNSQTYRFLFNGCSYIWLALLYFTHADWNWNPAGVLVVSLTGGVYTVLMEVIYRLLVRDGDGTHLRQFAMARIACDSVFITLGIHYTGRGLSPYDLLYLLLCIDSGLYFGRRGSLRVAGLCIAEYLVVVFAGPDRGYGLGEAASYVLIVAPFFFFVTQVAAGLAVAEREQRDRARRDPLTGLYNHGSFQEDLESRLRDDPGAARPLSVVLFDIDRFKAVNDELGHQFGDQVLREIARSVPDNLRGGDRFYRYGGEEFALILGCDAPGAVRVAERIRARIAVLDHTRGGATRRVTISAGVSERWAGDDRSALVERADIAAYSSKRAGRNTVTLWRPEEPAGAEPALAR